MVVPRRIISGGQTGVDRAALDWALHRGIEVGGWCPAGRKAEDGPIPHRYPLKETTDSAYLVRTKRNVHDSQATVIFSHSTQLTGGSLATQEFAVALGRPWLHVFPDKGNSTIAAAAARLTHFLKNHSIEILNIAGPRASEEPEAANFAVSVLNWAFPAKD